MYDSMQNFTLNRSVLISNRFDNVYGNGGPKNYYPHHTTIQITIEIERYLTDIFVYRNRSSSEWSHQIEHSILYPFL